MMNFWIIILLTVVRPTYQTLYSCNSSAVCGCSSNPASVTRIVGGEEAGIATWTWAVSLSIANTYLCGGSIVSSSWIITAAHCVYNQLGSSIIVYAGSNIRWSGSQSRTVAQVIVHPLYDTTTYTNDIALLQLIAPFNMDDPGVSTICMPFVSSTFLSSHEWPVPGTAVVAIGWGTLSEGGSLPQTLQQVTLETIAYQAATCSVLIADSRVQLCASVPGGTKDTCQGDSGGPLMIFTSSNQWVLVGLTSNGMGCAEPSYAGIYTRVVAFEDWIGSIINDASWFSIDAKPNTGSTSTNHLFLFITFLFLSIIRQSMM